MATDATGAVVRRNGITDDTIRDQRLGQVDEKALPSYVDFRELVLTFDPVTQPEGAYAGIHTRPYQLSHPGTQSGSGHSSSQGSSIPMAMYINQLARHERTKRLIDKNKCFKCEKEGHMAWNCPVYPRGVPGLGGGRPNFNNGNQQQNDYCPRNSGNWRNREQQVREVINGMPLDDLKRYVTQKEQQRIDTAQEVACWRNTKCFLN